LPTAKFKSLWPLPGGTTEYVNTLTKILEKVQKENPTYDELLNWFTSEYKLSGQRTPRRYLDYLKRFGFLKTENNRLYLTSESVRFLESRDNRIVYSILSERVLGLDDILTWLSAEALSENEIHERLTKKYNLKWNATHQTYFRLMWLKSLGYVQESGGEYYITDEGLKVVAKKIEQPMEPHAAPVIPSPLDKYINHATALIERYGDMSEANTISTLVEPMLEVLGWNIRDPDEVQRQYPVRVGEKTEFVDIALKVNGKPVIFIEAKSLGTNLKDYLAEQPINYALTERVNWCILTNGKEWRAYNVFWRLKGIEGKMFLKLTLDELRKNPEKMWLFSKECVLSGKLEDESTYEYAKRIALEWLKQNESSIISGITQLDPSLREETIKRILREIIFS